MPVESLGLGGFFSFSLSVLFLGFSFSFSFSLSTLSFSLLSFSFSLSAIFPGLSVGLVLKRMPLACKGITKLTYYQQQIHVQLNPALTTPAGFQFSFPFGGRGMGKCCTCIFGNYSCIKELNCETRHIGNNDFPTMTSCQKAIVSPTQLSRKGESCYGPNLQLWILPTSIP